jgi:hypothetical protein
MTENFAANKRRSHTHLFLWQFCRRLTAWNMDLPKGGRINLQYPRQEPRAKKGCLVGVQTPKLAHNRSWTVAVRQYSTEICGDFCNKTRCDKNTVCCDTVEA